MYYVSELDEIPVHSNLSVYHTYIALIKMTVRYSYQTVAKSAMTQYALKQFVMT